MPKQLRSHAVVVLPSRRSSFALTLLTSCLAFAGACYGQGPWNATTTLRDFANPTLEAAMRASVSPANRSLPLPRLDREDALEAATIYFQRGKTLLEQGHTANARAELDRSVEILLSSTINFTSDPAARRRLVNLIQEVHRLEVARMGLGATAADPVYELPPIENIPELTFPVDPSLEATVVDLVRARSGEFPLEVNESVLSYVRYFTSERGKRTFISGYRRSGRYRDLILRILDEEGLPRELLHLAQAESGFLPRAMSWAKAGGLWQFIPSRGEEYGLSRTRLTDERFDPEKATRAAARHLRDLYHEFGDWNLAMAAYNCGPACVGRAVERTGYADFWELRKRSAIPRETTNYVPIVQALAIIALNPGAYGIELPEPDPPLEFDSHVLEATTHLNLVADILGLTKAELRDLNPAVTGDQVPAGYPLRIPKQAAPVLLSGLSQIPETKRVVWRAHRVSDGDTLRAIAAQYRTSAAAITKANEVADDSMQAGDLLLIPATYAAKPKVASSTRRKATPVRASASKLRVAAKKSAARTQKRASSK